VAALIDDAFGVRAEMVEGARGEFSVWVDEERVAQKDGDDFPSDEDVLSAVRQRMPPR
jgi:hypothetical protein